MEVTSARVVEEVLGSAEVVGVVSGSVVVVSSGVEKEVEVEVLSMVVVMIEIVDDVSDVLEVVSVVEVSGSSVLVGVLMGWLAEVRVREVVAAFHDEKGSQHVYTECMHSTLQSSSLPSHLYAFLSLRQFRCHSASRVYLGERDQSTAGGTDG